MAISTAPVVSGQIYLGDLNVDVKEAEGDCEQADRAWVIVRQATERDQASIADMSAETRTRFSDDGAEQVSSYNTRTARARQIYACLVDAGNIFDEKGKKPLFKFGKAGFDGVFSDFLVPFGSLLTIVTDAMLQAVFQLNPQWDWAVLREAKCPVCEHVFELAEEVLQPLGEAASREQASS